MSGGGIKAAVAAVRAATQDKTILLHIDYGQPAATAEVRAVRSLAAWLSGARVVTLQLPHVRRIVQHDEATPAAHPAGTAHAAALGDRAPATLASDVSPLAAAVGTARPGSSGTAPPGSDETADRRPGESAAPPSRRSAAAGAEASDHALADAPAHASASVPARGAFSLAALRGLMPLLTAVGAQCAARLGACAVVTGITQVVDDTPVGLPLSDAEPHRRREFVQAFNMMLDAAIGRRNGVRLDAPLIDVGYADAIRLGVRLEVPFERTWSCAVAGDRPCGVCDGCTARARAFADARVEDVPA